MTEGDAPLNEAVRRLVERCAEAGTDPVEALGEKEVELELRTFFRCIPNERLKDSQVEDFLMEVLGRPPDPDLVERIGEARRGPRPTEEDVLELERRQRLRCATCGRVLVREARPHIDHIVPVALRGRSELRNYQLLCETCNLGKSKWMHWIMAAPFFKDPGSSITYGLRYAVLRRDGCRCTVAGCETDSATGALDVQARVPVQRGGRLVFDNLRTVCVIHAQEVFEQQRREALLKMRRAIYGAPRR